MSNLETIQKIYQAFGQGDIPFILSCFDENVIWEDKLPDHGIPWLTPGQGLDAVQGFFRALMEYLEFQRFQPVNLFESGQQVIGLIDEKAVSRKNGLHLEDHAIHLWSFNESGKITHFRHFVDTLAHQKLLL